MAGFFNKIDYGVRHFYFRGSKILYYSIIYLTFFLLIISLIYLLSILIHRLKEKYDKKVYEECKEEFINCFGPLARECRISVRKKNKKVLKELCIDWYQASKYDQKEILRSYYISSGLLDDDLRIIKKSISWLAKVKVIKRFEKLQLTESFVEIRRQLNSKNEYVRQTAFRALAVLGDNYLLENIPEFFLKFSKWSYLYLTSILYFAKIPISSVERLVFTSDKGCQKAAAIIMRRSGWVDAIDNVLYLAKSSIKDVRREAVKTMGVINDKAFVPVLKELIDDSDVQIRKEAVKSLVYILGKNSLPFIETKIDDSDYEVRNQVRFEMSYYGRG